ncbi:MAG: hypothetical protein RLZZ301_1161 [Bacteroidota bacterium]|jgi:peroxiredoxin Q/BCP
MEKLALGSSLPDFSGSDQNAQLISSSDYKGQRLVIYFYPKDDTPGCTAQACSIRDGQEALVAAAVKVIGISADSVAAHAKFSAKYQLNFPLIADTNKEILAQFGVWGPKKFMGRIYDGIHRTTFVFNEKSELIKVIDKPNTKDHANEVLACFS